MKRPWVQGSSPSPWSDHTLLVALGHGSKTRVGIQVSDANILALSILFVPFQIMLLSECLETIFILRYLEDHHLA